MSHFLRARTSRRPASPVTAASQEQATSQASSSADPLSQPSAAAAGAAAPPAAAESGLDDSHVTYPPELTERPSASASTSTSRATPAALLSRTLERDRARRPVPSAAEPEREPEPGTLYGSSPHAAADRKRRSLRERARARTRTDPSKVLLAVLLAGLVAWILPTLRPLFARSPPPPAPCGLCAAHHHAHGALDEQQQGASTLAPAHARAAMPWQAEFTLPSHGKGCHLVTRDVERAIAPGLKGCEAGLLTLFIKHTSAALALNENYDPAVRTDMDRAMDAIVPDHGAIRWEHTDEGPDDSSSHVKAALFGASITVPITKGRLNVGTWQGVYLCEWRKAKHSRTVVATILP